MRRGPGNAEEHQGDWESMDRALVKVEHPLPVELHRLGDQARDFIASAKAPATLRAYQADWRHFTAWAEAHPLSPMPAASEAIALYLAALAQGGHKASTIQRCLTAISQAHPRAK